MIASCPALQAPAGLKAPVSIDDISGHAKPPLFDIKGAGCQWRYLDTPSISAAAKVMLGGGLVLATGVLIGSS